MKFSLAIYATVAILLSCLNGVCQERSFESVKFGDFTIEGGKPVQIRFAQKDADTRQIRLVFEARLDWKDLGGYTTGLEIAVNGSAIHGSRLLNKPLRYKTRSGGGNVWCGLNEGTWMLMYSPDFSDAIKTDRKFVYGLYEKEQEPYRFVLDLTGLTQHVGENIVTFSHYMKAILRDVHIEFDSQFIPRQNLPSKETPAPTGEIPDCRQLVTNSTSVMEVGTKIGGTDLEINAIGRKFHLTTKVSLPDGKFATVAYNLGLNCEFRTDEYSFTRMTKGLGGMVLFRDTFTNLRQEPTGVIFENRLELPTAPDKTLFHGMEIMLDEVRSPTNPTLAAFFGGDCAAIFLEDDVSRHQAYLTREENAIGVRDRNLGLPPGGSHTIVWSIYFLPNSDYYGLINRVRKDWNSKFTIDGPFSFPYGAGSGDTPVFYWDAKAPVTERAVRDYLARRPVRHIITHVTGDYSVGPGSDHPRLGHGAALMTSYYKWWQDSTRNMTAALRQYAPDVNVYAYLHKNLCSKIKGDTEYAECLATDYTSRELTRKGDTRRYIPTTQNAYGRALRDTYHYLVEDIGANIYMDEICLGVTEWQKFPEWDGCTLDIDEKTHKVKGKLTIPTLLVRPFLDEMCDYLASKNRRLIANGAPTFRSLASRKALFFTEEGMGVGGLYAMHLTTPLAFCYKHGEKGYAHFLSSMSCGIPCFIHSGDWSRHVFPMTPDEIHEGYLVCQERIITVKSGIFGWLDGADAVCFVYDRKGNYVKADDFAKKVVMDGKAAYEIRMPSGYLAFIVRKDQADAAFGPPAQPKVLKNIGPYKDWMVLEADMRADSANLVERGDDFLELTSDERPFMFFTPATIPVKAGQKVRLEMTMKGTGKAGAGILVYMDAGWSHLETSVKKKELHGDTVNYSEEFIFLSKDAGAVRLCLAVEKDTKIRFGEIKATVIDK